MRRLFLAAASGLIALSVFAGPVSAAREFGAIYANDAVYRVFGNKANVPDGTGTDPFATFMNSTNSAQLAVAEFAPGTIGHHGGRWAIYRATWAEGADSSELVTSWSELEALVDSGDILLVRAPAADFRCPVLGNPEPIS